MKAVNADDGLEEFEFALDSGATETVIEEDMLSSVEIKEGAGRGAWSVILRPVNSSRTWERRSFRPSVKRS